MSDIILIFIGVMLWNIEIQLSRIAENIKEQNNDKKRKN